MVSIRKSKKYAPREIVLPMAHYHFLLPQNTPPNVRTMYLNYSKIFPVVYDVFEGFIVEIQKRKMAISQMESTENPKFCLDRILVELSEEVFNDAKFCGNIRNVSYNRLTGKWVRDANMEISSACSGLINEKYIAKEVGLAIDKYCIENKVKPNQDLRKQIIRTISNRFLEKVPDKLFRKIKQREF